jgi:hypothetical protein
MTNTTAYYDNQVVTPAKVFLRELQTNVEKLFETCELLSEQIS